MIVVFWLFFLFLVEEGEGLGIGEERSEFSLEVFGFFGILVDVILDSSFV